MWTGEYSKLRWTFLGKAALPAIQPAQRWAVDEAADRDRPFQPLLLAAEISDPALVFGRYRRIPDSLLAAGATPQPWRRLTGGRPLACAAGDLALTLVLGEPREPARGPRMPIPPEKLLNRCVRGILRGLASMRIKAFYPGRDFVTAEGKRIAFVSFDVPRPGGPVIVEAVVAMSGRFEEGEKALEAHGVRLAHGPGAPAASVSVREAVGRAAEAREAVAAFVEGFQEVFRWQPEALKSPPADAGPGEYERRSWLEERSPLPGMRASGEEEIPLGVFEALAEAGGDGRIAAAKITGDFIVDSPSVTALEMRLRGLAPDWREIGLATDATLARPPAFVLGLGPLRAIPDGILRALGTPPARP